MKKMQSAQTDKHMTTRSLYLFYKNLLQKNKILIGGSAHARLKYFEERI